MRCKIFLQITLCLLAGGCAYNEPPVTPIQTVSFVSDVKPIIAANCGTCHSDTSTNPDKQPTLLWSDYNQLKSVAITPSSVNPAYTILQARIRHIESPGMPYNRPMLPESEIRTIEAWIKNGAPNN
jgi:mono/diheme cytochrome c family protein